MADKISLPQAHSRGQKRLDELKSFADTLHKLSNTVGFKVSARGWCYILENAGVITKPQFSLVNGWINEAVREGFLEVDFVAEDGGRSFAGVELPADESPKEFFQSTLRYMLNLSRSYDIDWWDGEEYYIQMVVEKIDLKTLFVPVCRKYHIPIANARGWSSILQRAEFARRFKEAENKGLKPVLLYCGDHDPDGLRISDTMHVNLEQIKNVAWLDGWKGYDPKSLGIDRFGLNYEFIKAHNLSSIDNLLTGSGKNLASKSHPNNHLEYVQEYLSKYGAKKWEANALVVAPEAGRNLCETAIVKYLGNNAIGRFNDKRDAMDRKFERYNEVSGLADLIDNMDDSMEGED